MAQSPEGLISYKHNTDTSALEDLLLVMAKNVESAFLEAGATPGEDYSFRDLFTMGLPFALEIWKKNGDKMTFMDRDF